MTVIAHAIVGREEELGALSEFLAGLGDGPAVLLLEGEAGIGKTILWEAGIHDAESQGCRVLVAQPTGAEARISFAALGDLLDVTGGEAFEALPGPQRHALEVALALADAEGPPPEPHAIAMAFLNLLRSLATAQPVLLALDDIQWLDRPSGDVLAFAIRRLRDEPVRVLATLRAESRAHLPLGLDRAVAEDRLRRLELRTLSLGALHHLLRARLGAAFPRPTMRRLWELSGGNPFFGLELARAVLERGDRLGLEESLPLTLDLGELLRRRLAGLPEETRDVMLAVALASEPTTDLIRAITGRDDAWKHLQPAFTQQLLELEGVRLRFSHPLLAASAAAGADPARRRELHRRLATEADNLEERARHLALAVELGSDEDAAAMLEEAARRADDRGAPEAAAELLEYAVRLTPREADDDTRRRALAAAYAHEKSGDAGRAETILNDLIGRLPAGAQRAEAILARLAIDTNTALDPQEVEQALREAGTDARLRAAILLEHAQLQEISDGPPAALLSAREGLRLAEETGDETLILRALALVGHLETLTGGEEWLTLLERARELEARGVRVSPWLAPGHWIAVRLMWGDELERARGLLEAEYRQADALGDESSRASLCFHLTQLETRAGRAAQARAYADEGWALEDAAGREQGRATNLYALALAEANFGDPVRARGLAEEALAVFERIGDRFFTMHTRGVLAFLGLAQGAYEEACAALEGMRELRAEIGVGEPGIFPFDADQIEALIGAGRIDEAEGLADELEVRGRQLNRARLLATGARCRGLVLAGRGDLEAAVAALQRALVEHVRLPVPLERARTLLALGTAQRRAKQKRPARDALREALSVFEELGASLWAEKARAELARIGGRAPSAGELTPTEQRVAELVAEGRSNKEVARELFVTVKTVERNLSRVYEKLGVRSRAELAHRFTAGKAARTRR